MPSKKPPLGLRKPPAPVDLAAADRFVRLSEVPPEPPAAEQAPAPANAQTVKLSDAQAAERPEEEPLRSKSLVKRGSGRVLRRMTLYLPEDLARELAIYCASEYLELSGVATQAIREHLDRARSKG